MKSCSTVIRSAAAAAVLMAAVSQAARAGSDVTISGATLFESFFTAPASTNDFVDVNGNGIFGYNDGGSVGGPVPFVENIAPSIGLSNIDAVTGVVTVPNAGTVSGGVLRSDALTIKYRGTGSVNGIAELLSYAGGSLTLAAAGDLSTARINGFQVVSNGAKVGTWNTGAGLFPAGAAITKVDIAVSDVTTQWATQGTPGPAKWNAKPTTAGYGQNAVTSTSGYTNKLITLTANPTAGTGAAFNTNTAAPNAQTVYNTPIAVVPINIIANPGIGTDAIKSTDLQQLYVTGRTSTGENLVGVTRSIGSGTRNAAMNSLGVDPSMGVAENQGSESAANANKQLGAGYQSSNMTGSGDMETNVRNNRLSVGYTGSDRTVTRGLGLWGNMKVQFDHLGGTQYVTPDATSIVSNGNVNTGWRIYGNESFITVGDPNATAVGTYAASGNPAMADANAAKYVRNITESIAAYTGAPTSSASFFMPVTQLANNFVLRAAPDFVQSGTDATFYIANTAQVAAVKAAALGSTLFTGPLVSAGSVGAGKFPTRTAGLYSDGSSQNYVNPDTGAFTIADTMTVNSRNKISGDFSGDGLRNINDIPKLMAAVANPRAFASNLANAGSGSFAGTGMTADYAIPEVLGDFNGDGNFNSKDVRYFADGLAISAGKLDRKAGFTAVDANASANYFGTTLSTSKPYVFGDSRADVAGSAAGPQPGAGPTGADGTVNVADVDYVMTQIKGSMGNGTSGSFATLLTRAATDPTVNVRADLSADINGDLSVDTADASDLILNVLGTRFGDANLDGKVNVSDLGVLATYYGQPVASWSFGDFNGDGRVNVTDLGMLATDYGFGTGTGASLASDLTALPQLAAAVPEPASLAVLTSGGLLLLKRRRRH